MHANPNAPSTPRSVLSIGTFDGVHLGHRAIIDHARRIAHEHATDSEPVRVVMLAFDPHPACTLRPDKAPPRLTTRAEKVRRLQAAGADEVVVLEPTRELLGQTAERFIEGVVAQHKPVAIIEGADFRFGKGRQGDIALLREQGGRMGFDVVVEPAAEARLSNHMAVTVSSSVVRWLVAHGRMLDAAICLGEPYVLTAKVVQGEQRGRTIGVPTVNLDEAALAELLLPPDGVYAGTAHVLPARAPGETDQFDPDAVRHPAAISIGAKPTFGDHPPAIEAHLLDFTGDLYGRTVALRFARWLRAQDAFPGVDSLTAQLQRDIAHTRWCDRCRLLDPPSHCDTEPARAG